MLLIPFSSVVVWSCTPARAHAASPRADSDVESHIVQVLDVQSQAKSKSNPNQTQSFAEEQAEEKKEKGSRKKKEVETFLVGCVKVEFGR
jgi:hypothetical protein